MKKILLLLPILLGLVACDPGKKVVIEDTIVNKEIRKELDNAATWWWEVPLTKTVYYFNLKDHGDKEVPKEDYEKYKIGDVYTWEEYL